MLPRHLVVTKSLSSDNDFLAGYRASTKFFGIVSRLFSAIWSLFGGTSSRTWSASKEHKELRSLHVEVCGLYTKSIFAKLGINNFAAQLVMEACELSERDPSTDLLVPFFSLTLDLMKEEGVWEPPGIDWDVNFLPEDVVILRKYLNGQKHLFSREEYYLDIWRTKLTYVFAGILNYIPSGLSASEEDTNTHTLSIAMIDAMCEPIDAIERTLITFTDDDIARAGLFKLTREQFDNNVLHASGIDPNGRYGVSKSIVLPSGMKDCSTRDLLHIFLHGTPFREFFAYPYTLNIPVSSRFEHMHVVGGTGHGKTQLLQSFILNDLDSNHGLCVFDSQGDLIKTISHLARFDPETAIGFSDRLVIIDPDDIEFPPCLNLFAMGQDQLAGISPKEREMLVNSTVDLYAYLFGALLGAELTQRQGVIFQYIARLMMVIPGATVQTLRELMEDAEPFRPYIQQLQGSARAFFETQFFSKSFAQTRKQILTRLWGVLSNATLERMFSHTENKVDMFDAMNSGKIILINTAKDLLKHDGCQILGRFFIALLGQAVLRRTSLPKEQRKPFFVYIDEAHEYFDERIDELLNQARKYNVGIALAHQNLGQLSPSLKATVSASTSIKFAGGVSMKDAGELARDMRCAADDVLRTKKNTDNTEFACWIKNITPKAIPLSVPLGSMEQESRLSEASFQALRDKNRDQYCKPAQEICFESSSPSTQATEEKQSATVPSEPPPLKAQEQRVQQPQECSADKTPEIALHGMPSAEPKKEPISPPKAYDNTQHKYLQELIKQIAQDRGYKVDVEQEVLEGAGRVDVVLTKDSQKIACEISVTTSPEHELGNVTKCLQAGYAQIIVLAQNDKRLRKLEKHISSNLNDQEQSQVKFFLPEAFITYLDESSAENASTEKTVRGYKVKVRYTSVSDEEKKKRRKAIADVILQSMKRL